MSNCGIKFHTILQNSFDETDEDWVPVHVQEKRITDCDKKCLEKVLKRMAGEDKCKSQNLRQRFLKNPATALGSPRGYTPIPQEVLEACCDVLGAKNEVLMFDLTKYLEKQTILQIRVCLLF